VNLYIAALAPRVQLTAVAGLLAAVLALTAALTHHQPIGAAAELAGLAYAVVLGLGARYFRAGPIVTLLSTIVFVSALAIALAKAVNR
jgi:hypothetical protein